MLRELNENEMTMVSGGVTSLLRYDAPMGPMDEGYGQLNFLDKMLVDRMSSTGNHSLSDAGDWLAGVMDSKNCTPNGAQEAGYAGYGDMQAWMNGYGHTSATDGSAGALLAGIARDINNPGCPNTPVHPAQNR